MAGARSNRAFLRRAVTFLAGSGIGQSVDLDSRLPTRDSRLPTKDSGLPTRDSGLPTRDNVHQVVELVAPDARAAGVGSDPIVLVYARAQLADSPGSS